MASALEALFRFRDVPSDHWAFGQIQACSRAGIVMGYPDGTYQPGLPVTRDQMAVYISRAIAGGDANVPTGAAEPSFGDVASDHWAFPYIEYAAAHGVVEGYDDGTYHPAEAVTRDQMAVYVARTMVGGDLVPPYPGAPSFGDVEENQWAYDAIEYCHGQGVVQGYPDGTYHPEMAVTRDQMAVYVARAFELPL